MARDEILPISLELKRLTIVLANEIADPGLRKADPGS